MAKARDEIFPESIYFRKQSTIIQWNDNRETEATPSGRDSFNLELGILWALSKRFISTSKIVNAIFTGITFLNIPEGDMLWIICTHFMPEDDVTNVINFAKTLKR